MSLIAVAVVKLNCPDTSTGYFDVSGSRFPVPFTVVATGGGTSSGGGGLIIELGVAVQFVAFSTSSTQNYYSSLYVESVLGEISHFSKF